MTDAIDTDRLLDHEYDGIQEYDNPLPGWWQFLFWASIIFAPFYVLYYHIGVGPSIVDGYNASAADFYARQNEAMAGIDVDEDYIAQFQSETALMAGMKQLFQSRCATCHGNEAQGVACPNLTDDHWIHGGELMNIYTTIRDGVPGKEMKSWLDNLGPAGVVHMAAFIGTLRGTHAPGGKAPEGKLYEQGK